MNLFCKSIVKKVPGIVWIFLLLIGLFSVLSPQFLTIDNMLNIANQVSVLAIVSIGATFAIITGGIDLSLGAILSLASMVTAILLKMNLPPIISVALGIISGLICGTITGMLITFVRIPPFVVTLGMMSMIQGISLGMADGATISGLSQTVCNFLTDSTGFIPTPVIVAVIFILIGDYLLRFQKFGVYVFAIGGNEEAAKYSGVNIKRVKLYVYMLAGALAGFAGIILMGRLNCGHPTVGIGYEFDAIAAVVVGGTPLEGGYGSIFKTVIGVLIIGVIKNGLTLLGFPLYWQLAITGTVIILTIISASIFHKSKDAVTEA